ncbi:MAG: copper resistance protein CopC [Bacteroidales bacterium]|nr:copper resistance protein CopC [Candidatus Equimonas enterica]
MYKFTKTWLTSLFLMVMFALGSSAWAQTPVEFTFYDPGVSDGPYTQTKSGVTLTCYANNFAYGPDYAAANVYGNEADGQFALKVSSANTIVKVEMYRSTLDWYAGQFYLNNYTEANGKGSMDAGNTLATWTGEATNLTFVADENEDTYLEKVIVYVDGEVEEEKPEGLKEGNFYIYATDWTGEKIYLAPNADGTLGMVAFDDAADKTAYQWTLTAKNVNAKFRAGSYGDYSTENRDVDGFVIKNVKTSQYIVKGACYDSYPYWRIALSNEESAAHVYYTELQDGLYCLYDTDAPSAAEAYGESEWNSPHDYYGYLTTSGLTDSAYYIWTFAAVDAYNPSDKDVFIASLDENNKPQYFVTVSGDKAVADPNYEYDSYSSVAEFSLHQTETGCYQLLSGGKYVAADGTISDAACEYTLTEGILFNDITAAWFILDKNGEELSTYSNNKWSKSELESALQAVTDAAIDRTKYPEALLKELDDAVAAAQNLNQFYDDYSNFASAIKSALTKIAEYVEGTYQVAPAAGFQGYIANGGYAGYYMAYVDGEVKAVQFDESKADNFVWEIEANGDNLYIKHAATGKYLGGVHHYNCTGFGHTDAQGGYTEWAPRHAPDFGDLAQAHAYTFPTNSYYDWTKPGYIDGYAIADGKPCYLPGWIGSGDSYFPYATIMDDNGEPNGVIYGENSMNNQKSSVWKFFQLEAPVALTPEVVANNVPEEAVATLMSVELTYNTEVKVADKTLVTFTDAKGQTIDGVSASIMSPTGKGADFKKIIVGFVGLENLASGTYTVTLAEGAVANRADDTKVAKAYSFSFTLDVPLPEYKTFALKSSTPANGATVQNITEATLVFDGNIGEITNAAAAVLTKDGVSAGNTYMEVATDVAGTITVAFDEALAAGTYTLTIPAETIWNEKYNAADANKGIYAGARCNDEIVITFTVEKADGINGLLLDGNAELYNLNGVRANANAKGVVVGKGIKVLRK